MKRTLVFVAALCLGLSVQPAARMQDTAYYWNPQGGRYYHSRANCEAVAERYWGVMEELTPAALQKGPYSGLIPCPICHGRGSFSPTLTGRLSFPYKSPYDTAEEGVIISTPGDYQAGVAIRPGIYTVSSGGSSTGAIVITKPDGDILRTYHLGENHIYTIYLGNGMRISLPDLCTMEKVRYHPAFQSDETPVEIERRRYLTRYELAMRVFYVKSLPGKNGFYTVSSIRAEMGEEEPKRVDIAQDTTVKLDLGSQYDTLVEFVHCMIWPEAGEG